MKIEELLHNTDHHQLEGNAGQEIHGITLDSREVEKGFLYAAIAGTQVDGHRFIESAIEKGACAILCTRMPDKRAQGVAYIKVEDSAHALGNIASTFYGNPSSKLKVIAVTGTNGKTTCSSLLYELFSLLGNRCGLLSTVEVRVAENHYPSTHTTPHSIAVQRYLSQMVDEGCTHCFMEASSHAIVQHRLSGVEIDVACFTNLSHDHLDYHETFAAYRDAKKKLFDQLSASAFCLSNKDDKNGAVMLQNTKASRFFYSLKKPADFKGRIIEMDIEGMLLSINQQEAWYQLTGEFNASNLLLVYGVAFLLEVPSEEIGRAMSKVGKVPGRF